jgi:hypothetical protein
MTRLQNLKVNPIIAGLLILIILAIAVLVVRSMQGSQPNNSQQQNNEQTSPNQVTKKDTKSLEINGKNFQVPTNWNLSAIFTSVVGTNYSCVSSSDCFMALVTNDAKGAKLDKVVVSWPSAVKSNQDNGNPAVELPLNFLGETVKFTAFNYYISDGTQSGGPKAYTQIYGCTKASVCVQADFKESEPDQNAKQLEDFKFFLKEFKLQ